MNIYQANILDRFNNPKHRSQPTTYTHTATVENLACGDTITVYLTIVDKQIESIHFEGEGCVIALAAAEIIAEHLSGKSIAVVAQMDWEDAVKFLQIELSMTRIKCAHLPLEAIQQAATNSPTVKTSS